MLSFNTVGKHPDKETIDGDCTSRVLQSMLLSSPALQIALVCVNMEPEVAIYMVSSTMALS